MTVKEFIKFIAEKDSTTIKQIGIDIGRGASTAFWRTVTSNKTQAEELKKIINSRGEPFIIKYKGEDFEIK